MQTEARNVLPAERLLEQGLLLLGVQSATAEAHAQHSPGTTASMDPGSPARDQGTCGAQLEVHLAARALEDARMT